MAPADGNGNPSEIVYGCHAVREVLRAGTRPLLKILLARRDAQTAEIAQLARAAGVTVHFEPRPALDRLAPAGKHQGVVGLVGAKRYVDVEDMLTMARRRAEPAFIVILDGVQDPHNFGAVLRTADAAGAHGVCIPERRAAGLTPAVAKASAGAVEHVPVASVPNVSRLIEQLQGQGVWVYGFDADAKKSYLDLDLCGAVALVFGGEGTGIRRGVLDKCDERARIPMRGRIGSLNVSAAAAVVLFEVARQRGKVSGSE